MSGKEYDDADANDEKGDYSGHNYQYMVGVREDKSDGEQGDSGWWIWIRTDSDRGTRGDSMEPDKLSAVIRNGNMTVDGKNEG
jgi:hypothetical protein